MTLRELLLMCDGRIKESWTHTSAVLTFIANGQLKRKGGGMFKPDDFNPVKERPKRPPEDPAAVKLAWQNLIAMWPKKHERG